MVFERVSHALEVVFYGLYLRPRLTDVACFIYQTSVLPSKTLCSLNFVFSAKCNTIILKLEVPEVNVEKKKEFVHSHKFSDELQQMGINPFSTVLLLLQFLLCYVLFLFLMPSSRFLPLSCLCVTYFCSRASAASFWADVAFPTSFAGPEQALLRSRSLLQALGSLLTIEHFALPSVSLQLCDL